MPQPRHLVVPREQEADLRRTMTSDAAVGLIRVLQHKTLSQAALDIKSSDFGKDWESDALQRQPRKESLTDTASWEGLAPEWRSAHLCHCFGCASCRPGCPERGSQGRPCDFPLARPCLQYRQRLKDVPVGFCRRCDAESRWPAMGRRRSGATLVGGSRSSSFPSLSAPARSEGTGSPGPALPIGQLRRRAGQQWMQAVPAHSPSAAVVAAPQAQPPGEACQRELFLQRQHRFLVRRSCGGSPGLFAQRCGESVGGRGGGAEGWGALEFRCATMRGSELLAPRGGEDRPDGGEPTIWDLGAQLGIEAPPPVPPLPLAAGQRPVSADTGAARAAERRPAPLVEARCDREVAAFELGGPAGLTEAERQEGPDNFVLVGTVFDHVVVDTGAAHVPGLWYYHIGCPRDRGGKRLSAWRVRVCDGMPFDRMIVALEKDWRHVAKFQLRAESDGGIRDATRWAIARRAS